jgi:hypothetical protein
MGHLRRSARWSCLGTEAKRAFPPSSQQNGKAREDRAARRHQYSRDQVRVSWDAFQGDLQTSPTARLAASHVVDSPLKRDREDGEGFQAGSSNGEQ